MTNEVEALKSLFHGHVLQSWRPKLAVNPNEKVEEAVIQITPSLAKTLLETRNKVNRNLSRQKVQKLKNTLIEGRWNPEQPDSVGIFGQDGQIKNFQHRLTACVETGLNFTSRVEIGHKDDILLHLDQTEPRTEAQQAKILGRPQSEVGSYASVKWMWKIENEKTYFPFERGTKSFDLIDQHYPRNIWEIVPLKLLGRKKLVAPIRATLLLLATHWPKEVALFVGELKDLTTTSKDSGPYLLFHYLINATFMVEKDSDEGCWAMVRRTFRAFHLYLTNGKLGELRDNNIKAVKELRKLMDANYKAVPNSALYAQRKKGKKVDLADMVDGETKEDRDDDLD